MPAKLLYSKPRVGPPMRRRCSRVALVTCRLAVDFILEQLRGLDVHRVALVHGYDPGRVLDRFRTVDRGSVDVGQIGRLFVPERGGTSDGRSLVTRFVLR